MSRFPINFVVQNEFYTLFRLLSSEQPIIDADIEPNSLVDIIKSEPRFSRFYKVLNLSQYDRIFAKINSEKCKFTLFVPNNDSIIFSRMVFSTSFTKQDAIRIMNACIVKGSINYETLLAKKRLLTPNTMNKFDITAYEDDIYINNVRVIKNSERVASNGIIHEVEEFIDPINRD